MPEVAILGADQKERGLWGRECSVFSSPVLGKQFVQNTAADKIEEL